MDKSCPEFTKNDGEFEDNTPFVCGEYQDPYAEDEEPRQLLCASDLIRDRKEEV